MTESTNPIASASETQSEIPTFQTVEGTDDPEAHILKDPEICLLVLRHFQPTPGYSEENPLVMEKAEEQADAAYAALATLYKENDAIWLAGSGIRARHQASQEMLHARLVETHEGPMVNTQLKRPSLRNVRFDLLSSELRSGDTVATWMSIEDDFPSGVESERKVVKRIQRFVRNFTKAAAKLRKDHGVEGKVIIVMFTSAEVILPYMRALLSKNPAVSKMLKENPESLTNIEPGEGFQLRIKGDEAQILYPTVDQNEKVAILSGSSEALLSQT